MIYLYIGLGLAMLLPIMVGLQTAVSVSELERGDYAVLNDPESKPVKALQDRMEWSGEPCESVEFGGQKFILIEKPLSLLSSEDEGAAACPGQL